MLYLPQYIYLEIFLYLTEKEIFTGPIRVCKEFNKTIRESTYLTSEIFKNSLGITKNISHDFKTLLNVYRKISLSNPTYLQYKGFATTGGFDEDESVYWVGNLYKNDGSYYCSRDNKLNINTAGILEDIIETEKDNCEYILKILQGCEIIANSVYPRFKKKSEIGPTLKSSFQQLFYLYRQEIVTIVSDTFSEPAAEVERKIELEVRKMKLEKIDSEKFRKNPENLYVLQDNTEVSLAKNSKLKAIVAEVEVSREGQFTCPVETFMVLTSETYVDIESEAFDKYNDFLTYESLLSAFPKLCGPLTKDDMQLFCGFNRTNEELKPVAWGKFLHHNSKVITIKLTHKTIGNFLYLKLINPDNRMTEMNDTHDHANIDANYVIARGWVLNFNN